MPQPILSTLATAEPSGATTISRTEFRLLRDLIFAETGIHLSPIKRALLVGRLSRRLRALGLASFGAYYERLAAGDPDELVQMIDAICTNETHFFREPRHFVYLAQQHLPALVRAAAQGRPRGLRVLSAGCSTGEEPFSLAMLLDTHCPPAQGWRHEIIATDLSTRVLAEAREGIWPLQRSNEIPADYLKRYMLRGIDDQQGKMKARAELRQTVQFCRLNLNAPRWPVAGQFDLIFCRNVLIYFTAEGRLRVVDRLLDRLAPNGLLFVGHAESLAGITTRVRCVEPTIYARRSE